MTNRKTVLEMLEPELFGKRKILKIGQVVVILVHFEVTPFYSMTEYMYQWLLWISDRVWFLTDINPWSNDLVIFDIYPKFEPKLDSNTVCAPAPTSSTCLKMEGDRHQRPPPEKKKILVCVYNFTDFGMS